MNLVQNKDSEVKLLTPGASVEIQPQGSVLVVSITNLGDKEGQLTISALGFSQEVSIPPLTNRTVTLPKLLVTVTLTDSGDTDLLVAWTASGLSREQALAAKRAMVSVGDGCVNKPFVATNPGESSGSLTGGVLCPDGTPLQVVGYSKLSDVIPGIDSIRVVTNPEPHVYAYTLEVYGACPSGAWDNLMYFTDESPDTYSLRIFSSSPANHTVNYNSPAPAIVVVTWDI